MAVNPYQTYKNQSIMLASREELTLMLYNGCARFIQRASMAIDESNIPKAHESIVRAQDIISELMNTLNMEYEISNNLMSLYTYMIEQLMDANIRKDKSILVEVLEMITSLSETWETAMSAAGKKRVLSKSL